MNRVAANSTWQNALRNVFDSRFVESQEICWFAWTQLSVHILRRFWVQVWNLLYGRDFFRQDVAFIKRDELLRTGPSLVCWEKDGISISGCLQNVFYSICSQIWTVFEPVQGPCTTNMRNKPLHDMVCVAKRENPTEWRWKLCEFQHGKSISVSGIDLIGWWSYARANAFLGTPRSYTHYHALHHPATYYHTQYVRFYK